MASDNEVVIKLRVDNTDALSRVRETEGALRRLTGAGNIPLASAGGGAGGGAGVGGAGLLGGLGIGKLLGVGSLAAVGTMAFGPLASDIGTVGSGVLGNVGRQLSAFLGIQGAAGQFRAIDRAADQVATQLGPTRGVSDDRIREMIMSYRKIYDPMEGNRNRVENVAGLMKAEALVAKADKLVTAMESLVSTLIPLLGGKR